MYRRGAMEQKKNQDKLSFGVGSVAEVREDLQQAATAALVMDFDRSWWTIREKLDAYFDAAENRNTAIGKAVEVMTDYTSNCAADLSHVSLAQKKTRSCSTGCPCPTPQHLA